MVEKNNTAAKSTPAKKVGVAKVAAPAIDFKSLTPTAAAAPVRGSGSNPADNPAVKWMQASWDEREVMARVGEKTTYRGKGQALEVPKESAQQLVSLIRSAANHLKLGASVEVADLPGGKARVTFAAKTRKAPRKSAGTSVAPLSS